MAPALNTPPTDDTDAFRLYDGEEAQIDAFAGHWLVQTRDRQLPSWIDDLEGARSLWWKRLDQETREPPVHLAGEPLDGPFLVREHGVAYEIDFQTGYSQGIFLDQRLNRQRIRERVQPGDRILNTFAYTGAFSVVAALGGAVATSVDLSRNYLEWAKRNFQHNGLDPTEHYFTKGDTFDWLRRWAKAGTHFDGVILDPPTFSRNAKGKIFRIDQDFGELVALARSVVPGSGWILCSTNCRSLDQEAFLDMIHLAIPEAGLDVLQMPPEFDGEAYLKLIWAEW